MGAIVYSHLEKNIIIVEKCTIKSIVAFNNGGVFSILNNS